MDSGDEAVRKLLSYPSIRDVLVAENAEGVWNAIEAAHARLEKAESVISILSDRLLTDCQVMLPLADAVIGAVPGKTEEAAFAVMEKFTVVREASSNAAAKARLIMGELADTQSENSVSYTSERSRAEVRKERAAVRELSVTLRENRDHLDAMSKEIESGLALLKNITEITEQSKLIAFNMSIEAARIGEKGRGFKVIITELHKLNDRTFEFSRQVAALLSRFRDHNALLVASVEEKAGAVISEVERGMDAAEASVESLIDASSRTENFARDIALMSESIDHDLDGVLESLQFQDITRQMIEGAQKILTQLNGTLDECLARSGVSVDERRKSERFIALREKFVNQSKTKGEKVALMEVRI
jgi:methyl-accepting chemotaxis protein